MRLRSVLIVLLSLGCAALASARIEVVTITVEGHGATPAEAVTAGLALAVAQVHGIELEVTAESRRSAQQFINETQSTGTLDEQSTHWARSTSQGLVSGFRILERSKDENRHRALLKVDLPRLQHAASTQRVRAAVSGFTTGRDVTPDASRLLEDRLATFLTQTRRFAVLDRSSAAAIQDERERMRSSDVAPMERVRLGQELAADLLLTGEIEQFQAREESFTFRSGNTVRQFHPEGSLSLRILDLASGEIRFAQIISVALEALPKDTGRWGSSLADALAQETVRRILEAIFPIAVLHVDGETVYLNTGGDVVSVGDYLDVFALEGQLLDPYTGERLGPIERLVGRVQVKKVNDKQTLATIVQGNGIVDRGNICRIPSVEDAPPSNQPPAPAARERAPRSDSDW